MIIGLALFGIVLCLYGFAIEQQIRKNSRYKPVCDISDSISCSKAIKSAYGKMLGVPNTLLGICFYLVLMFLQYFHLYAFVFYLALLGAIVTIFFAFILYARIKTLCVLCTIAYIVNFLLLYLSYHQYLG
ncbi:hypothetical protein HOM50_04520 [bacterium]|jgi:vitamin-K-epoxide reductase (warfarin-sensitive)|nr:hypothetical protein [bacterium]MBT5015643.1 hypothetical protein [bacterium]